MKHRKSKHIQYVSPCRVHLENKCSFGEQCWYKHETNNTESILDTKSLEILSHLENKIMVMENEIKMQLKSKQ